MTPSALWKFTRFYIYTALETSFVDGAPLGADYTVADFEPQTLAQMQSECREFLTGNRACIPEAAVDVAGHDFWITRSNFRDPGFRSGFWPKQHVEALVAAAEAFGKVELHVNSNNKIACRPAGGQAA